MATLEQVVKKALEIMDQHNDALVYDSGFDAGEFSGPAHAGAVEREIRELAQVHGFSYEQVWDEITRLTNEVLRKERR
jgi:hypothetical protein